MAKSQTVRWLMGQRVTRMADQVVWEWQLDGKEWTYDERDRVLYLTQGTERKRVCSAECLKLAVGFSVGVHEAMGLRQESQLLKVIGG